MPHAPAMGRRCAVEWDGGDDGAASRTAHYRVTNASGEERSGGSLETFGQIRRDAADDEGSEVVARLDHIEGNSLGGDRRNHAAGSAGAALVRGAFAKVGLAGVRMSDMRLGRTRVSSVSVNMTGRIEGVVIVKDGGGVIV